MQQIRNSILAEPLPLSNRTASRLARYRVPARSGRRGPEPGRASRLRRNRLGWWTRARRRRPPQPGPAQGCRLSRRKWCADRTFRQLHASRLHRPLEPLRTMLGLPLPWLAIRRRWRRAQRPGDMAAQGGLKL